MTPSATIRLRALDAAISLLAAGGVRALTHGRVDERAGLPKGSTSNYFRTRASLVQAVMDRIVELETPRVGAGVLPRDVDGLVGTLTALFDATTGPGRELTTARLVLFTEAVHDPEVRESVSRGRAALETIVVPAFAAAGAPNPELAAQTVMATMEGLILHRVVRGDPSDATPVIDLVVRAALDA
ncbi:TetR family transcriptional regulator [Gordonia sinesedis]